MDNKRIVLVDDDITILNLGSAILGGVYDTVTVPSGEKLFTLLEKISPDLILLDVDMPGMSGFEVIVKLKEDRRARHIPVIFLTSKSDPESELKGLSLGAVDYIFKPFSPPLLLKRLELHLLVEDQKRILRRYNHDLQLLVREKTLTVMDMQNSVLKTVAELVEYRDELTGRHIERTQRYLEILLASMTEDNIYREELLSWNKDFLLQSSQLHDLGKISIPDSILLKPGKLTAEEFDEMKNHAAFGVTIIEEIEKHTPENSFLEYAKIFAGTHHEKWDGSGYPRGLRGVNIPLQGRLMAVADVYDALISVRPYKAPMTHKEAAAIIFENRGSHFDPAIVEAFTKVADGFAEAAEQPDMVRLSA